MMRALWTAATGMTGQQTNVDVIANNLSNVNTISNKKSTEEGQMLVNSQGFSVLDAEGESIVLDLNSFDDMMIGKTGEITIRDKDNGIISTGIEIGIVKFQNPAGLLSMGDNNYSETANSGSAVWENAMEEGERSTVMQYYLEGSNVQLVDEMVNLIIAQRAYEINSKAVNAADEMLQQANNLRR